MAVGRSHHGVEGKAQSSDVRDTQQSYYDACRKSVWFNNVNAH
jgi:hypothetical protein